MIPDEDQRNRRQRFAALLWELADLERADAGRRSFRAKAYRRATWALDHLRLDLEDDPAGVMAVPGIGVGIASLLASFRADGSIGRLDQLRRVLPSEAGRMSRLPRMTGGRLRWLKSQGVETCHDLARALEAGAVAELSGIGARTSALWSDRLARELIVDGMPILEAISLGREWKRHLTTHLEQDRVTVSGAARRLEERVVHLDLVVVGEADLAGFLEESALVQSLDRRNAALWTVTVAGPVVFHPSERNSAGSVLLATTGPEPYVRSLGDLPPAPTEAETYRRLDLPPLPPPARGQGPMPPDLLTRDRLRGDLHVHSDWSPDGRQSLEEIVEGAVTVGHDYIAITDHGTDLRFGGLQPDTLVAQREVIDRLRERYPHILILHGAELNIGRHGTLDYDDVTLSMLDFRLAGVHSHFDLDISDQTDRLLDVIANPLVHAIAHPTGRRIGVRPSIRLDMSPILEAAAETSTALEANGHLDRLDLPAEHARRGARLGVLFLANSDAHRTIESKNQANAVGILQRAGVAMSQVINTWDRARLTDWLQAPLRNRS